MLLSSLIEVEVVAKVRGSLSTKSVAEGREMYPAQGEAESQ